MIIFFKPATKGPDEQLTISLQMTRPVQAGLGFLWSSRKQCSSVTHTNLPDDEDAGAAQMQLQANKSRPGEVGRRDSCIDQAAQPAEIKHSLFQEVTLFLQAVKEQESLGSSV